MQEDSGVAEYFNPVWSRNVPLSPSEYGNVMDEINATCKAAYPKWKRKLPLWCIPISFLIVCLSGTMIVFFFGPLDTTWAKEVLVVVGILVAMLAVFFGRWLKPRMRSRLLAAVRRNLNELNGRYIGRNVDFQLHESKHLNLYFRSSVDSLALRHEIENGNGGSSSESFLGESSDYFLVVQSTRGNDKRIPTPGDLRAQTVDSSASVNAASTL